MKELFAKLSFVLVSVAILSSCGDKDDDPKPTPTPTKTELLTGKNWKPTAAVATVDGTDTDLFPKLDACSKDDFTKFNANGTAIDDQGALKCDPAVPQTSSFNWAFNQSETVITDPDSGESYIVLTLTSTTLKVSTIIDGITVIITYTAQ